MGCAGCDKPVLVRGNGPAIADAVRNLIENAVTYAPVGDEVKVTVDTRASSQCRITDPAFRYSIANTRLSASGAANLPAVRARGWASR